MMTVYFNEFSKYPARWLGNLFPHAVIDSRDIQKVKARELREYSRVHLFAGIGGWEYAFKLAGWPDGAEVWSGSCPCQPFSQAGSRKGESDPRHLWPQMRRLISKCHPATIFGEQVASAGGRKWLLGVQADLEALGYGFAAADLCAAGVQAPHARQRLFWMADSSLSGFGKRFRGMSSNPREVESPSTSITSRLADTDGGKPQDQDLQCSGRHRFESYHKAASEWVGNSDSERSQRRREKFEGADQGGPWSADLASAWKDFEIVKCSDGKARRIGTGVQPLAYGIPNRVGKISAYGNAIVPQVAAMFIQASMKVLIEE